MILIFWNFDAFQYTKNMTFRNCELAYKLSEVFVLVSLNFMFIIFLTTNFDLSSQTAKFDFHVPAGRT